MVIYAFEHVRHIRSLQRMHFSTFMVSRRLQPQFGGGEVGVHHAKSSVAYSGHLRSFRTDCYQVANGGEWMRDANGAFGIPRTVTLYWLTDDAFAFPTHLLAQR